MNEMEKYVPCPRKADEPVKEKKIKKNSNVIKKIGRVIIKNLPNYKK